MKILFIIFADFDSLLEKMITYHNSPKKSSTTVIHCLYNVQLMLQKISLIVIEVKTVWKSFVRK